MSQSDWTLLEAKVKDITALKKARDELFGQDLGSTPLTTKNARIAYLAHIVASDPDGPRGNESSHALSDSPENIMLMCDGHHRLIDRIG